ncbi:MAG: methyltransferase domain-containing protein [Desulfotalea sp.]
MIKQQPSSFADIDWQNLHSSCRSQKAWKSKTASDWDKKAHSFSVNTKQSEYTRLFINNLNLDTNDTILDVGAGSGALSHPLAQMGHDITAIDYSKGMLAELETGSKHYNIDNIKTIICAWEDDWQKHGVFEHDIAIASRSLGVKNLQQALIKLNNIAKKRVFLTDRMNPSPFDSLAFQRIGRPFQAGPDYIFTINMLYSIGIQAEMKIIEFDHLQKYTDLDTAVTRYSWMFTNLTATEKAKLADYLTSCTVEENDDFILIKPSKPHRWAFIHWAPTGKIKHE